MQNFDMLRSLTETPGIAGREERVRKLIQELGGDLFDSTHEDAMGNLICTRKPDKSRSRRKGKRIMLASHMDEIGFYVSHVDEKGFLRLRPAGGFDARNLFARRVLVQGKRDVIGLLNPTGKPIHLTTDEEKSKVPQLKDFFVDLGLPAAQVKQLVRIGDPVTLIQPTERIGDIVTGKALDDRIGAYVALCALRNVAATGTHNEIVYVATVQEEVGCRGAGPAAYGVSPDVAVALDTNIACDTPGTAAEDTVTRQGGGATIRVMDGRTISDRGLVDEFVGLANRNNIPHQLLVVDRGGTDASTIQASSAGCKTLTLSVPCRYVHTITESIHTQDIAAVVNLLTTYLAA